MNLRWDSNPRPSRLQLSTLDHSDTETYVGQVGYAPTPVAFQTTASTKLASPPVIPYNTHTVVIRVKIIKLYPHAYNEGKCYLHIPRESNSVHARFWRPAAYHYAETYLKSQDICTYAATYSLGSLCSFAPYADSATATHRLTADCSTSELIGNIVICESRIAERGGHDPQSFQTHSLSRGS